MLKKDKLYKYSYGDLIFLVFLMILTFIIYSTAENLFTPFTMFVIVFLISVFVFFSYLFHTSNLYLLYFSILTFIISFWLISPAENYLENHFNIATTFNFKLILTIYLAIPFLALFFYEIFKAVFSEKIMLFIQVHGFFLYLFIFLMPSEIEKNMFFYNFVSLIILIYFIYISLKAFFNSNKNSIFFFWNLIFLTAALINNYLYSQSYLKSSINLKSAVFSFVFLQTIILIRIYSKKFKDLEKEVGELQKDKTRLKKNTNVKNKFMLQLIEKFKLPVNRNLSAVDNIINNENYNQDNKKEIFEFKNNSQVLNYMLSNAKFYFKLPESNAKFKKEKIELKSIIQQVINYFEFYIFDEDLKIKNMIKTERFLIKTDRRRFMHIIFSILSDLRELSSEAEIIFKAEEADSKLKVNIKLEAENAVFMQQKNSEDTKQKNKIKNVFEYRQQKIAELFAELGGELKFKKAARNNYLISLTFPGSIYSEFYLETENKTKTDSIILDEIENNTVDKERSIEKESKKKKIIVYSRQKTDNLNLMENFLLLQDYEFKNIKSKKELMQEIDKKTVLLVFNLFSLSEKELRYCREIRERFSLFQLPILIIASRNLPQNMIKSFEIGINDFIKKPFEINELKSRIRTLITLKEKVEESFKREQNYLRAQIKPHFLYNTLDTIAYLCDSEPELAGELIIDLANYLRYSFDFDNLDQLVPIQKELDLVKFYVSIQQQRFKNKFKIEYEIDNDLNFNIPPLMLQSLVENSIKHGFAEMKKGGLIKIKVREKRSYYLVKVEDNGRGIEESEIENIFSEKKKTEENKRRKIGLKNINKRLKKIFDQTLEIESSKIKGTTVRIKVPKNYS